MAEKGKYSSILAEIQKEQKTPPPAVSPILIPAKPPPPAGKRSDPAFTQKGVFLKKETIALATAKLKARNDKTDFSDLVQALLDIWLTTQEP